MKESNIKLYNTLLKSTHSCLIIDSNISLYRYSHLSIHSFFSNINIGQIFFPKNSIKLNILNISGIPFLHIFLIFLSFF